MKVFIVASDEPVYLVPYLRRVISSCRSMIVGVAVHAPQARRFSLRRSLSLALLALLIISPRQWAQLVVWRLKDLLSALGLARTTHHLADVCRDMGVPVRQVASVNAPAFIEYLREQNVDVLFHQTPEILRAPVLGAPRIAVVNRHMSLLPAYRGAWPIFWQLANGEQTVGVSVHIVDEGIDSGAVLSQQALRRERRESMSALLAKLFDIAAPLTCEALTRLSSGRPPGSVASGTVFRTPTPAQILRYMFRPAPSSRET